MIHPIPARNLDNGSYLGRLTQTPLLTAVEERILTTRAKEGCAEARARLIEANMRLVINIARNYHTKAVPLEDLIQEGAIGLMQAVSRFDPDKGFRFSTYATHWIRQAIGRAIDNKGRTIRLPSHVGQAIRRLERLRQALTDRLGRDPTPHELAESVGLTPDKLAQLMGASGDVLSLDAKIGDGSGMTLGSLVGDDNCEPADDRLVREELCEELNSLLDALSQPELAAVKRRFRLESLAEVGLSQEKSREIQTRAIKKLRRVAELRRLKEYLDS